MAEEMRFHLEQRAADRQADGLSPEEARYAAERKFGNVASLQEQAREGRGGRWLEDFGKDLRQAALSLVKSPGFALLAIGTLSLGIGANTAMFNVLKTMVLKPVPYADAPALDRFFRATPQNPDGNFSAADFRDLQRAADGYGQVAAYAIGTASLAGPGRPAEMAETVRVTPNFLGLLGIQPQLGRDFRPGEDTPGSDRVVILSQRTWRGRFGARPEAIGGTIRVDGVPHQIIGVLPDSFNDWRHLGWVDFFRPLALDPAQAADRSGTSLRVLGRRAATLPRADTDGYVAGLGARLAAEYPEANTASTWRTESLQSTVAGRSSKDVLPLLIGLSGFVLLIACSNLANLLLVRTMTRAREFAVRAALGASRLQLLRPLVAEALVLALAGGAGALLVAQWVGHWLAQRSTGDNGEQVIFTVDWPVFGWALGAALVTAVGFGLAPALFALRLDLNHTLKSGGRGTTGGRGHQRFRSVLIAGQFALAMVLLAGAGLFIRGLDDLNNRRAGWDSSQLVSGTFVLPVATYGTPEQINAFHRRALERLEALPGVASAGLASSSPFIDWSNSRKFLVEGRERPERGREPLAVINAVTPHYLESVGTRLLSGRAFGEQDRAGAPRTYLINQAMATGLFAGENPVGRRLALAGTPGDESGEIVGVVADVQSNTPATNRITYQLYLPMAQEPARHNELFVRASGVAPAALVADIRSLMTGLDQDLPVRELQSADLTVNRANYQLAVLRDMLASFAVLGLGLAALGIYGVIARAMAQRRGEFAIRLALGAGARDVTRLVLASGVRLALVGAALGLLGALGVARLLASGFPGMALNSVSVLAGTALLLVAVALLACWLPARRAAQVDAIDALRAD